MNDYIFCPLCGETDWTTNKTRSSEIETLKCSGCKNFRYTNSWTKAISDLGLSYFKKERIELEATVGDYLILISYKDKITSIRYSNSYKSVLELKKAVDFNWYKADEVLEKIQKYLLFS